MKCLVLTSAVLLALRSPVLGASTVDTAAAQVAAQKFLASAPITTRSAASATTTGDRAALVSSVLAANYSSQLAQLKAASSRCPLSCTDVGLNSSDWFQYHNVDRLNICNSIMLLDFSLQSSLGDSTSAVSIAACTADLVAVDSTTSTTQAAAHQPNLANYTQVTKYMQMTSSGQSNSYQESDVVVAINQLRAFSRLTSSDREETIVYAYSGNVAVGIYAGPAISSQGVITSVLNQLSSQIQSDGGVADNLAVQLCEDFSARYALGIYVNTVGNLASVQSGLQAWKNGTCVAGMDQSTPKWQPISFLAASLLPANSSAPNATTTGNTTTLAVRDMTRNFNYQSSIRTRDTECTTVQVVSGDSCATLAAECGITAAEFTDYNPSSTLCSTLAVGEHVCCSSGTLPDYSPQPQSDGYCYTYLVQSGDSCSTLAATWDITEDDIESWNADTWGWTGCSDLLAGYNICLSSGYSPMPATISNAVCGPQVVGTVTAPVGTDLSTLNECPLNACCDIWGQCGTTAEFCTVSNSSTGAPGTAAPGENGCISNCGTDIVVSSAPAETFKIAYFEGFDWSRPCSNPGVEDIDTSIYTHIHFAFATINADWSINITSIEPQLPIFTSLQGIKKIISIGGWAFSTDADTYTIFRDVVASETSRQALISNLIEFMNDNDLDGVDFDWEYPDEPDIPGIPAGTIEDSTGFFLLLDELETSIATNAAGKTISITVPASFWYLQYFPVLALSEVVDYMVFMTYDLHGQWDYGKASSDPGCTAGDCLRSHVNLTETINSLSMITKAGVPSSMIVIGVSSYARSFEMTTADCWTEMCTYVGPESGALPGPCTDTAGYISNYELALVLEENPSATLYWDEDSYSNIMVYNGTQWAAYMNDTNKAARTLIYEAYNFLGTSDWAVDLQGGDSGSSSLASENTTYYIDPDIWSSASPIVAAPPGATLIWPPMPLPSATTITFPPWTTTVSYSSLTTLTSTLSDGSTSTYPWYNYVPIPTVITIPAVTTTAIPVWGVTIPSTSSPSLSSSSSFTVGGIIVLTSSVQPDPFVITVTPVVSGTTSIIDATDTTTSPGTTVIWGSMTDIIPPQTFTLGGSTTVIGGTTLPPATMTVTPNPHPTTTDGTTDPVLNSKTTSWKSDITPSPTASEGCPGCGTACLLFCDPDCPECDPGVFGASPGGDSDDDTSSSSSSTTTIKATVLAGDDSGDVFPTTMAAVADLDALWTIDISIWDSMFPDTPLTTTTTSTTSTTKSSTTSTSTPTPTPTPTCECYFWDEDFVAYEFLIWNIAGWSTDGGDALHTQEDGCGALTFWTWTDATSTEDASADFDLPFFIKDGCVERAIVSAGGPKISCQGQGTEVFSKKREELEQRRKAARANTGPTHHTLTQEQLDYLASYYGTADSANHSYVPMDWSSASESMASTTSSA